MALAARLRDQRGGTRAETLAAVAALAVLVAAWTAPQLSGREILVERDALPFALPTRAFLARAIGEGRPPWWNPAPVLGKPFFAEAQTAAAYPPSLLLAGGSIAGGLGRLLAFHLWIGGAGMMLWLVAAGLSPVVASVAGIAWTFGGAMLSLAYVHHFQGLPWLPWVLWGWTTGRGIAGRIARASMLLALPLLAGSLESAALTTVGLLAWSRDARSLAVILGAAGLAGVQLLPFSLHLLDTGRGQGPLGGQALRFSATPAELAQFVAPIPEIDPTPFLRSVYLGPIAAALALLGLSGLPRRSAALATALAVALAVVALGAHTPIVPGLIAIAPFLSAARYPEKALLGVHALLAAGVGLGAARIAGIVRRGAAPSSARRRELAVCLVLAALLVADLARAHLGLWVTRSSTEVLSPPPAARAILADPPPKPSPMGPRRYFANPVGAPPADTLEAAAAADREVLLGQVGEIYGLADLNSPGINLAAHDALVAGIGRLPRNAALRVLAALGTCHVTSWSPLAEVPGAVVLDSPGPGGASPEGDLPRVHVLRLPRCAPRARLVHRVERASDAPAALARFLSLAGDDESGVAEVAVLDDLLPSPLVSGPGSTTDGATIRRDEGNALVIDVATADEALLVVADTWTPGWTVAVDGVGSPLRRVDGLLRAVAVPAGRHEVVMRYRPPGLVAGALVSIVTAGALVAGLRRSRRVRAAEKESQADAGRPNSIPPTGPDTEGGPIPS